MEFWRSAMSEEYQALMENQTWTLTKLPDDQKSIGCRWVFKIKYNPDGTVERYKARLVAKGYSQTKGIDYTETFAPVAKFNSIRLILAISAKYQFYIHQMDVKTAFLNGELTEDIYMDQPDGFVDPKYPKMVCKLKKTLYGLKQSPRAWNSKIDVYLETLQFQKSKADYSIYYRPDKTSPVLLALYVDDLIIATNNLKVMEETKSSLSTKFKMTDLGELTYYLGIQINMDRATRTVTLNQSKYILDILRRFKMEECKPVSTPMETNLNLTKNGSNPAHLDSFESQKFPYQSMVGSLMYIMVGTRPDIAYSVGVVSQYLQNYGSDQITAVKRIFRYLKGSIDLCLKYTYSGSEYDLLGYSDANWGRDIDDRRSTTGYTFLCCNGAISWNSKKQPTVALSPTEAEYMAACEATKEAMWLRKLLKD